MYAALMRLTISTRAPREGSDKRCCYLWATLCRFLPALPARGATIDDTIGGLYRGISTRAPREGSDLGLRTMRRTEWDFYPRSPRGERPP